MFLIISGENTFLVDCATTKEDVNNYIISALELMGIKLCDISAMILSHRHSDHSGGLECILECAPSIKVITEVGYVSDDIEVYPMPGHTEDMVGVLDRRTGTLISADGLQGAGRDKYRCSVKNKDAYIGTIERIRQDARIENILFSHAYEPWDKDSMIGRKAVISCLDECLKYI